jgi:hypothetical protein
MGIECQFGSDEGERVLRNDRDGVGSVGCRPGGGGEKGCEMSAR